ncbi:MAG: endonuclease III [Candidatus Zixiibacteriota bacterium]|nr:MAG: endonuclease III [candidate division Zixibacteria bacterium]
MKKDLRKRIKSISLKLEKAYGRERWDVRADPLSELIATILSQNTSDQNSHRAYASLRSRFETWDQVRSANVRTIASAIRSGGLADIKAQRIKSILNQIHKDNRNLDLSFLKRWRTERIRDYLGAFEGVGEKTVACVLLFSLKRPVMPVDTHVWRVSRRIGLVPVKADAKRTEVILEELVPGKMIYQFHMNLIAHGRNVCKATNPRCEECVLLENCDFGGKRSAARATPPERSRAKSV